MGFWSQITSRLAGSEDPIGGRWNTGIPLLKMTVHWVVKWKDIFMGRNALAGEIHQVLRIKAELQEQWDWLSIAKSH